MLYLFKKSAVFFDQSVRLYYKLISICNGVLRNKILKTILQKASGLTLFRKIGM